MALIHDLGSVVGLKIPPMVCLRQEATAGDLKPRERLPRLVRIASGVARTLRSPFASAGPSFAVGRVESESGNGSAGVLRLRAFGDRC
jgi:hypothetical protein